MSGMHLAIITTIITVVGTWVGCVKAKEKELPEKFMIWGIIGLFVYSPFASFSLFAFMPYFSFKIDEWFFFFLWFFYIGVFFFISVILIGCGFYLNWKQEREREKEKEENIEK